MGTAALGAFLILVVSSLERGAAEGFESYSGWSSSSRQINDGPVETDLRREDFRQGFVAGSNFISLKVYHFLRFTNTLLRRRRRRNTRITPRRRRRRFFVPQNEKEEIDNNFAT